jgi:prepilin signal peptidase PulO-like enzyme (type II secretory pathway)
VEPSGAASWAWLLVAAALGAAAVSSVQLAADRASATHSPGALQGRSRCPGCATALKARDVVPILGFTLLLGRCRSCNAPIPQKHLFGEVAGAVAWSVTAAAVGVSWWLPLFLVAPFTFALPRIRTMRSAWLLAGMLPTAGSALLTLGAGGVLSGDWTVYLAAGLVGTAILLMALAAARVGGHSKSLPRVTT